MDGDGDPINLRAVSVSLCIGNDPPVTVDVVDADEGRVQCSWTPGDTAVPGEWNAEFILTFANGTTQRVPGDGFMRVRVNRSLCGSDDD